MRKHTFTIFNADDSVYGYLFDATRIEVQAVVSEINANGLHCYYMEGFIEG